MNEVCPQIAIFTEHGLREDQVCMYNITNYVTVCSYCRIVHKSGGVMILARKDVKLKVLKLSQYCEEKVF